ncbi:MAG TPA: ClpXP protease specificity-enhancing factor, partial [Gallionellaceae bacterium]|nr:ClpXP protease specificity-enhancing factor [Gallionellaceae bacterium]
MSEISTKPYLIRAIYDWCTDNNYTPYLAVRVDQNTQVPAGYVKDGEIILNISMDAVHNLQMGNDDIRCNGRFGGVAHQLIVPVAAVIGIFAKESGQGLVFQGQEPVTSEAA